MNVFHIPAGTNVRIKKSLAPESAWLWHKTKVPLSFPRYEKSLAKGKVVFRFRGEWLIEAGHRTVQKPGSLCPHCDGTGWRMKDGEVCTCPLGETIVEESATQLKL